MPRMNMLEALRAFVESGSVSQAATRLGRSQPQVGRLLAALEEELGFTLFTRENRRLVLTAEGRRFHQQSERVLAGHEGLNRLARQLRAGQRDNHLRILTAPQVTHALLREPLREMARAVPEFSATVEARLRLDAETLLDQEHFDLGVTVPPLNHPGVRVELLCDVEAVMVMPRDHPLARRRSLSPADLAGQDLVATHPRSVLRTALEQAMQQAGIQPRIRFEGANGAIACQLVAMGLGIGLADPFVARSSGAAGLVMRRFEPSVPLRYGLFTPAFQPRSDITQQFCALLAAEARRQAAALAENLRRGGSGMIREARSADESATPGR